MRRAVCLLPLLGWLGLGIGCAGPRANFFPLGIYGVRNAAELETARNLGCNLVCGAARREFLDEADARGLKVLAAPPTFAGKNFSPGATRQAIASLDHHPALWAWYLVDEPDLNQISPREVAEARGTFKALGARKPTALVVYQGQNLIDYRRGADILMFDRYPIPWLPLANFGQHARLARLAAGDKPLLAVIQAFDWNYFRELLPDEKNFRAPTYEELKCMTYLALTHRADGLLYYALHDGKWDAREHPEIWGALQRVLAEVNERRPLFQAVHEWWLPDLRYRQPSARFNASLETSITTALVRVRRGSVRVPAGRYIVAVNTTEREQIASFLLPHAADGRIAVFDENRSLVAESNRVEDRFAPFALHVYGPLP
ncbi:MAG: hypothetical protein HY043_16515 [Verrucomicrobia bacterium]|nr:hypothetical protein [Verrucomicrobiota bacterium]